MSAARPWQKQDDAPVGVIHHPARRRIALLLRSRRCRCICRRVTALCLVGVDGGRTDKALRDKLLMSVTSPRRPAQAEQDSRQDGYARHAGEACALLARSRQPFEPSKVAKDGRWAFARLWLGRGAGASAGRRKCAGAHLRCWPSIRGGGGGANERTNNEGGGLEEIQRAVIPGWPASARARGRRIIFARRQE